MLRTLLTSAHAPVCAIVVAAAAALTACGAEEDLAGSAPGPTVVVTTTQAADLARNVAGDRADVVGLLAPSSDPHDYEPRPSDAEALIDAGLVVESGGDLDLWLDELVESSGTDAPVVTLLDSVETIEGHDDHADEEGEHAAAEEEHAEDEIDPHWWQSPANAAAAVEVIRDALVAADPDGREEYEANAEGYIAALEDLDARIAECMQSIPTEDRKLVTSHDALAYFAARYEIEVIGSTIPALTTQAQPSAGETAELVELIRDQGVNAVFSEVGVSSDLERAVADETGAAIGGELYADALGSEGSPGATYIGAMEANAEAMAAGFSAGAAECVLAA